MTLLDTIRSWRAESEEDSTNSDSSSGDNGCVEHHFEDYKDTGKRRAEAKKVYTVEEQHGEELKIAGDADKEMEFHRHDEVTDTNMEVRLFKKLRAKCEHHHCWEGHTKWEQYDTIELDN